MEFRKIKSLIHYSIVETNIRYFFLFFFFLSFFLSLWSLLSFFLHCSLFFLLFSLSTVSIFFIGYSYRQNYLRCYAHFLMKWRRKIGRNEKNSPEKKKKLILPDESHVPKIEFWGLGCEGFEDLQTLEYWRENESWIETVMTACSLSIYLSIYLSISLCLYR